MSNKDLHDIRQEVKERELAKIRWQWFKEYRKCRNVVLVCKKFGINRSKFYYWKKRRDLPASGRGRGYAKWMRLMAYSRRPQRSPRDYPKRWIGLIVKIRKRTNRGADHIWFMLRDKYAIYVSVSGVNKVLKRMGMIPARRQRKKRSNTYEAPKYLPGEKIQIDVK